MSARTRVAPSAAVAVAPTAPQAQPIQAPAPAPAEQPRGGVLGWFQRAGDWMADKYHATTDAVGQALYDTGRVASDAWDVAKSTDLSWKDGKVGVQTDLKEVMDLLPKSARDRLRLDERAQNRVSLEFDTASRELALRSDELSIEGMDLGGVRSGQANLKGVTVRVRNPGDALGMLSGPLGGLGKLDEGVSVEIGVDEASAQRVTLPSPDGPVAVRDLAVSGFRGSASNTDGLPFGADARGTRAAFSVAGAQLGGVRHAAGTLDAIGVGAVQGGLDERAETAFLEVGSASATGARGADGRSLGSAGVRDARIDLRNDGGGMPLLDGRDDHLQARVTAGAVTVDELAAPGVGVRHAGLSGLAVDAEQDTPTLALAAAGLDARGVDVAGARAQRLSASGLGARRDEAGLAATVGRLSASDAGFGDWHLDEAGADDVHLAQRGGALTAAVAALDVARLAGPDGASVGGITAAGASGSRGADGAWSAGAERLQGRALSAQGWQADALTAGGVALSGSGAAVRGSVADLTVGGLDGAAAQAGEARARGLSGSVGADGAWKVAADLAGVEEAGAAGWWVGSGEAERVSARGQRGTIAATAGALTVGDVSSDGGTSIGRASATGLRGTSTGGAVDVAADGLHVRRVAIGDVGLASGRAEQVSARVAGGRTALEVPSATVQGFDAKNFRAALAELGGASVELGPDDLSGSVESARVEDATLAGVASVKEASVSDASGSIVGDRRRTEVGSADVSGLTVPGVGSVGSAALGDVRLDSHGSRLAANVGTASARQLAAGSFSAGAASATGVDWRQDPARAQLAVDDASLERARFGDAASVARVSASGVSGAKDARGVTGGAASVRASDLDFRLAPGGAPAGGPSSSSPFDPTLLATSLARRVDRADAVVDVPVAAGTWHTGVDLRVPQDTWLQGGLKVRDNQLTDLSARLTQPVDGPLWTDLKGVYTEKGALQAEVGGWFDQNVSGPINASLGLKGDGLYGLSTYADAAVAHAGRPATPSKGKPGLPGIEQALDPSRLSGSAAVHLSPGRVDAGSAALTLSAGDRATNRIEGQAIRGEELRVDAPKLRADDARAQVGGAALTTGAVAVDGARVVVDLAGPGQGTVAGSVDEAAARNVRLGR
jgi:hypothetical protein